MDGGLGGSGLDTKAGDTVVLQVSPDGPYGISLRPDESGNAAVIHSFDTLPSGKFGPIQKHGGIHYGDVLAEINDVPLYSVSHNDTLAMLANKNTLKKILKFQSPKVYYRKKNTTSFRAQPQDGKNSFLSAVKRSRFSDAAGKKYVEYEIACQYRLVGHKVHTEVVYQWSVWKRYSEFESLHTAVKKSLGWQMDGIDLPSPHTFVMNKLSPEFVDQRREDLKDYWQKVISIDKVMDFAKHHCSEDIKAFLQVDDNTKNKEVAATADLIGDYDNGEDTGAKRTSGNFGSNSMSPTASGAPPSRRGSVRTNSRRITAKTLGQGTANGSSTLAIADVAHNPEPIPEVNEAQGTPLSISSESADQDWEPSARSPPVPPPRPAPAAAVAPPPPARPSPTPSTSSSQSSTTPPKTAARVNLLDSIAALRKD